MSISDGKCRFLYSETKKRRSLTLSLSHTCKRAYMPILVYNVFVLLIHALAETKQHPNHLIGVAPSAHTQHSSKGTSQPCGICVCVCSFVCVCVCDREGGARSTKRHGYFYRRRAWEGPCLFVGPDHPSKCSKLIQEQTPRPLDGGVRRAVNNSPSSAHCQLRSRQQPKPPLCIPLFVPVCVFFHTPPSIRRL
jgi:hypothetical protein